MIHVQPEEGVISALKRFRREIEKAGIPFEMRRRAHFLPSGQRRRL